MKNTLIAILALVVVVVGYIAATATLRVSLTGLQGKTETITRGDLTVPINATGEILSARRVVIKAEASGEVIKISKQPGDPVRAGDLLVRIQPDDEERNVNRAKLDVAGAAARLEETRITLQQARTADLAQAAAGVAQIEANLDYFKFRTDHAKEQMEAFNEEERLQRISSYKDQLAKYDSAKANLEKVKLAVPRFEQQVKQAEATYETFMNNLGDAQKRLSKTDIIAPMNGIVAQIHTQIGEVIQGGKTTITGGTELAVVLDMDTLLVRAEVDEADIGRVLAIAPDWAQPGHRADVRVPSDLKAAAAASTDRLPVIKVESFRDEEFAGIIERVYPEPRILSGVVTYLVDVVIISENRSRLLPGMRADVRFTSEFVENVVLCPNEAIHEGSGGKYGVYVPKPSATDEYATEFVPCELGLDNGNYSEVRSGLDEGMVVYTKLPAKTNRDKNK